MKSYHFILLIFLIVLSPSLLWADCQAWDHWDDDVSAFGDLWSNMAEKFPFSIVGFSLDIIDQFADISPTSPADLKLEMIGLDIYPLSWLQSDTFDTFAEGFRILLLIMIIFSVAKHVIEKVL